jgi:hypothetical protein
MAARRESTDGAWMIIRTPILDAVIASVIVAGRLSAAIRLAGGW